MAKVVDITEKLNFEENPKIKIKNVEIEVNSEATAILEAMQTLGDSPSVADVCKTCKIIFADKEQEKIKKLKLKMSDYMTLMQEAINLVIQSDDTTPSK